MANNENLRPIQKGQLSKEELKRRQSNGGKKSGEKRRERKTFRELLNIMLQETILNESTGEKNTRKEAIMVKLISKALNGDLKAIEMIRDTIGEKPTDKLELTSNEDIQKGMDKINSLLCKQKLSST